MSILFPYMIDWRSPTSKIHNSLHTGRESRDCNSRVNGYCTKYEKHRKQDNLYQL